MKRIQIVPFEEQYIEACARIGVQAWEGVHEAYIACIGEDIHEAAMGSWRQAKELSVQALQAGSGLVALLDGKAAGYISFKAKGITGKITDCAVAPELWNGGIGDRLFKAALDALRGAGCKYAAAEPGLEDYFAAARRLCRKNGFEKDLPSITYYQTLDPEMEPYATQSDTVQVVPCEEKHLEDCARITLTAWNIIHDSYISCIGEKMHNEVFAGWQESTVNSTKNQQMSGNGYVALVDGKVAGFASYRTDGKLGVVSRNAVDPAFRGRGIAKLLYGTLINCMIADGYRYAKVHTGLDEGHTGARKAYGKVGFERNLQASCYYREL